MSDGSPFSLERDFLPPISGGTDDAWVNSVWNQFSASDFRWKPVGGSDADVAVLGDIGKVHFTTAAADAAQHVEPDFILGKDGKLVKNPKKTEPNADGSITVEVASDNASEMMAKKAANELQRAWARDMIQRWQNAPEHRGEQVPQEWLDLVSAQDAANSGGGGDGTTKPPPEQQPQEPMPEDIPAPSTAGGPEVRPYSEGGGGGSGGGQGGAAQQRPYGGGGDGGGVQGGAPERPSDSGRSMDSVPNVPKGSDVVLPDVEGPTPGGVGLEHYKAAVERANSGGEPVRVLQYGDSHIAAGTEPKTIEQALDQLAPTDYSTMAKSGISANYPLNNPGEWLDKPLQQNNPDLVILSFGSNDAAGPVDKDAYVQQYQKLVDAVHQRAPNADIVIVGPTDGDSITGGNKGNTLPGLDAVVEAQKEVAARNHLQFVDQREMMGGPGSVEDWHQKGLAAGDKLHFTTEGYRVLGEAIGNHIKNAVEKK